ncbi:DUF4870 domain-containing protein [Acaryochloris sp. 'Moss Beach']|uniref:DUF4870 domain-containing protein n=1 Tax=Acaryochloris sp. 'Moss Beach' TaxID=2740837 RepID=UPI001F2A1697|nr:DUF4870 domain-containing protein [Acaryochloris sp. 'Moss Beach']UJB68632.1 DUF4870 domain-containing protein [Acaryochloris sp. 'Moss Beach']
MVANIYDPDKRKLLSSLSHGSIFLSALVLSIGIPLVILIVSDDPVVKANAREAINFHVNVWFYGILFGILCWVLLGWPLLGLLFVVQWVMPVLAIRHCLQDPDEPYNYSFIFHVL